ncbi:MAG TPA: class I SAM-dependent methyltransferase [Solirubrobacterales bacterium]|nr:class I SAM-dependent methyltransferase [Solirubrobacterales bacterium]
MPRESQCRFCGAPLVHSFADLGMSPLANRYLTADQVNAMEPFFPLHALVCERCFLVQLEEFETPDAIFSDYAYFSSFSTSWLEHCRNYAETAIGRFGLGAGSQVVELASNDGYLLQYFKAQGVPVLGVEPAANVARVAEEERGIRTVVSFFGRETAGTLAGELRADLLIGNNVLAHVPDLNDFVAGMKTLLADNGVITMEFPHLMRLVEDRQFDTIYHEHFSYFSFLTVKQVFAAHGLELFDVDELPTHGGSLRIYACHEGAQEPRGSVAELERREEDAGYRNLETYTEFSELVKSEKREILSSLIALKGDGASIVGYGAPAKGNTLLNYCGIGTDFIDYTVDRSPHKQGHFLPGTHIPIRAPEEIDRTRPDVVFILPWNLREEIMDQLSHISDWGGRFLVRSPALELHA